MSRIISLSVDNEFANGLDTLIEKSGYKNRSRFLRDAALFFAEMQQRGDLLNMTDLTLLPLTPIMGNGTAPLQPLEVAAAAHVEFASASNVATANTATVAALAIAQPNKCIHHMPRGIIIAVSALFIGTCCILF